MTGLPLAWIHQDGAYHAVSVVVLGAIAIAYCQRRLDTHEARVDAPAESERCDGCMRQLIEAARVVRGLSELEASTR